MTGDRDYVQQIYDSEGFSQVTVRVPVRVVRGCSIGACAHHNVLEVNSPIMVDVCRVKAEDGHLTIVCIVRNYAGTGTD